MAITPTEVHLKREARRLEILWSDGRQDVFALRYLRGWCPCAHCQGHFVLQKRFVDNAPAELLNAEPVGTYAMRFTWIDGHDSGIYPYAYLREIAAAPPGEGPSNDAMLTQP